MSYPKRHKGLDWLLRAIMLLMVAFLCFQLFLAPSSSERAFARRVQKSITRVDQKQQQFKSSLKLSLADTSAVNIHFNPGSSNTVLYVFQGDELQYWNQNLLEPRQFRNRVPMNCDSIIHFNAGDFLVSSWVSNQRSCYLFTLVNTCYPIENDYFVNKVQSSWGKLKIQLCEADRADAFPMLSASGKTLAYAVMQHPSSWGFFGPQSLALSVMVLVFAIYLLLLRRLLPRLRFHTFHRAAWRCSVPYLLFLVFYALVVWGFKTVFHYGFTHGFFFPEDISIGFVLLAYFMAFLLFISLLLCLQAIFSHQVLSSDRLGIPILLTVAGLVLINILFHLPWLSLLFGLLILVVFVGSPLLKVRGPFMVVTLLLFLWSMLLTQLYHVQHTRYEEEETEKLALQLADERDPDFEQSYQRFLAVAQHDTTFFSMVLSEDIMEKVAEDYVRTFLFDSVMNHYNVTLTLCDPGLELVVQPFDLVSDCMGYFQNKVNDHHGVDLGDGLAFLDYHTLDPSYLAMLNVLENDTTTNKWLFLEFSKPIAPQGYGLLRLLQGGTSLVPVNASVACYQDSVLVYKYGSYVYPNYLSDFDQIINDFTRSRRMRHYIHQIDEHKVLAISTQRHGWMEMTVPFVFFFVSLFVLYLMVYFVSGSHRTNTSTLSRKFQVMVFIALGISFLVVGPVSVIYMRSVYAQKTNEYRFERTRSLLQDITSEVDFSFLKQPGFKYELDKILRRYSETFYTDINIYNLNGKLLSTTSPEIQDLHLQAGLMNGEAYHNMDGGRSLYHVQNEHLGEAIYPSTYISIMDGMGNPLAFLNAPFFSSRSGLRSEIVNFVLTYINIILLIIFLILPFVLLLTRRVTDPLMKLQDKMRQIDINKSNEQLEWKSRDEIGALVEQYNQLVVELEKSAAELRRTTTESAWRGAARQVAHEIKNSLTPMRLSIQMLERAADNHPEDLDQRIKRTSSMLIEQIDALSDIASSFSTYAKLPENHPEPLDLSELVGHVVHLYNNMENIEFQYHYNPNHDYSFVGDKTHLNSAVTNLVKNATQAIGSKSDGKVVVSLQATATSFIISVKDNGRGIKEEDKKMIFLPNFTTKSGGSGVGLSLTYNIVQMAGGSITFESTEGEGAEFIITLPK